MLMYLLKMIACSAAFYGLYALLFRNEKMLVFNRFYLIASLLLSFIIPLISFTLYVNYSVNDTVAKISQPVNTAPHWMDYGMITLAPIFIIGSTLMLVRFIRNLLDLRRRTRNSYRLPDFKGAKLMLLHEPIVPHSFLNTIFLNTDEYKNRHIEAEVMEHELAHVQQKHSWDILLIELVQIFCWFNPVIYLYKRSIKINHELLADAAVIKKLGDVRSYQAILLQRAVAQSTLALASSFNFSTTKKRMIMLTKKTNPYQGWARSITALPMLAILIFLLAERSYAQQKDAKTVVRNEATIEGTKLKHKDIKSIEFSYSQDRKKTQVQITYPDGRVIEENLSNSGDVDAFEKKYGIALPPPPPPEPATKKKQVAPPPPPAPAVTKVKQPFPPPPPPKIDRKKAGSFPPPVIVRDEEIHAITSPEG